MAVGSDRVDGRSLRYDGRRASILEAVTAYVLANGVADLSMRPLAEAVGVSHASLLKHFGSKERLVTEVIHGLRARAMPEMPETLPDDIQVDCAALMRVWWDTWQRPEDQPAVRLVYEIFGLALHQPEKYRDYLDGVFVGWGSIVAKFVAHAGCPADEVELITTFALSVMRGLQMDLLVNPGERERVEATFAGFLELVAERQATWHPENAT